MLINQIWTVLYAIALYGGLGIFSIWLTQRIANAFFICVKSDPEESETVENFSGFFQSWMKDMYEFYCVHLLSSEKAMDDDLTMRIRFITFVSLASVFYNYHQEPLALVYIPLIWFVVPFSFVDSIHRLLPVFIILKLLLVGVILSFFIVTVGFWDSLSGFVISVGFLVLLNHAYTWVRGQTGIAPGDVVYIGMCGVWFGLEGVVFIFLFSSFVSILATVSNMAQRTQSFFKTTVPFGPYITTGMILYIIFKRNFNDILGF